jgi:16S rRNA G966 N2-methylase RsmD
LDKQRCPILTAVNEGERVPKLDWIGKQYVVNHTDEVPFRLLQRVPEASVGEDSGNMIVHGDNLEALKALLPYYRGQVKLVFIDPPYNTGNENWIYNDRMNAPKIRQWLGNDWAALDPERQYFKMVTRTNMQSTLKEVGEL